MPSSKNNLRATMSAKRLNASLNKQGLAASLGNSHSIKDHARLTHLDYLESGHKGFAGIQFGTTAEWNSQPDYRPVEGMLVVYTDYKREVDPETGQVKYFSNFKIGDGNAYLIDKPFVGDDIREVLQQHMEDTGLHIQPGEREFWNNKLNYEEPEGDLLEFTRD